MKISDLIKALSKNAGDPKLIVEINDNGSVVQYFVDKIVDRKDDVLLVVSKK